MTCIPNRKVAGVLVVASADQPNWSVDSQIIGKPVLKPGPLQYRASGGTNKRSVVGGCLNRGGGRWRNKELLCQSTFRWLRKLRNLTHASFVGVKCGVNLRLAIMRYASSR